MNCHVRLRLVSS